MSRSIKKYVFPRYYQNFYHEMPWVIPWETTSKEQKMTRLHATKETIWETAADTES